MRYRIKKRYPIISCILIAIMVIAAMIFVVTYIDNPGNRWYGLGPVLASAVIALIRTWQDLKSSFTITDDFFHYIRSGLNAKVSWDTVCRIEYSNVLKAKAFDCMIIYCGYGKLYIDYTVENYLELWELIIKRCEQQPDNTTIDPKLYTVIAKRLKK